MTANDGGSATHRSSSVPRRSGRRAGSRWSFRRTRGRRTTSATPTATAGGTPGTRKAQHGRARTRLHPPGRAAAVAKYDIDFLHFGSSGRGRRRTSSRSPTSRRSVTGGADPPLRLRDLLGPHGVRDKARVRRDAGLPRPRRQPGLPLGEQLLLGGAPAGGILPRTRLWRDMGRPEAALLGVQYRGNDDGRLQSPFVVATTAPWLWAGTGLGDGATFGEGSAATGSRSTWRRRTSRRPASSSRRRPRSLRLGHDGADDLLRDARRREGFAAGAIDLGGTALVPGLSRCSRTSGRGSRRRSSSQAAGQAMHAGAVRSNPARHRRGRSPRCRR